MSRYDGRAGVVGRLGALAGAAWVILILVGNSMTESGAPTTDTPAGAKAYFQLLTEGWHRVGLGLELVGFSLMVVFLARLHAALRAAEDPSGWLSGLALAGGLTTVSIKLGSVAPTFVGLLVTDLPAEQAQLLLRIGEAAFLVSAMTSGLLVLGAAGSALTSGLLPRWLCLLGLAIGALAVLGSVAPSSMDGGPGIVGFLLGLLWLGTVSVLLGVRRDGPAAAVAGSHEAVPARA